MFDHALPIKQSCDAMPKKTNKKDAVSAEDEIDSLADYSGLAEAWEENQEIRRRCLENKVMIQWLGEKLIGVVTMETLKLNTAVVLELLKIYLPQCPNAKTCDVNKLKEQAGLFGVGHFTVLGFVARAWGNPGW